MHYLFSDTERLILPVPFELVVRPASAQRFLKRAVEAGDEWGHVLSAYPDVRCEPLGFHYVCLQNISAFGSELMADLAQHFGWRGAVWGSLLAALSQDARYLSGLDTARRTAPRNQWAMDLAQSILNGAAPLNDGALIEWLSRLRAQLAPLPRLPVNLRRCPSREETAARAEAVRVAYRNGDFATALAQARR